MKASIYSVYMSNISQSVLDSQKKCVECLLPVSWTFEQYQYTPPDNDSTALVKCLEKNKGEIIIFLDIDCIPLTPDSLPSLVESAAKEDALVGCVQRANHIDNNSHLYAGPFCMAFKVSKYKELNSPTFLETQRGDRAEELTYAWEEASLPVKLLWPSHVELPMWNLTNGVMFGLGSYYDNKFYHSFGIRQQEMQDQFVRKCEEVIKQYEIVQPVKKEVSVETKEVKPRKIQNKVIESAEKERVQV